MDAALWGALSALSFGSADFLARFTGRRLGPVRCLFWALLVGLLPIGAHLVFSGAPLVRPTGANLWLILAYGVLIAVATLLLYEGLARGPVTVVAPVVAGYPAVVVLFALLSGRQPGALQLLATGVVIAGALVTARYGEAEKEGGPVSLATLGIAVAAALSYAVLVIAGQAAVPAVGHVQTALYGRVLAVPLVMLLIGLSAKKAAGPGPGAPIYAFLTLQGALDGGGHLLLFLGSRGANPEIAAVTGSCFGAVTTLLAYFILRERVTAGQWGGIALVFSGVLALSLAP